MIIFHQRLVAFPIGNFYSWFPIFESYFPLFNRNVSTFSVGKNNKNNTSGHAFLFYDKKKETIYLIINDASASQMFDIDVYIIRFLSGLRTNFFHC